MVHPEGVAHLVSHDPLEIFPRETLGRNQGHATSQGREAADRHSIGIPQRSVRESQKRPVSEGADEPSQYIGPGGRSARPRLNAQGVREERREGIGTRGREDGSVQDEPKGGNCCRALERSCPQSPSPAVPLNL